MNHVKIEGNGRMNVIKDYFVINQNYDSNGWSLIGPIFNSRTLMLPFATDINKCIITVQCNNKTEKLEISQWVDLVRGEMGQLAGNGRSEESKKCSQDA